jgi:hypothetical protein
MTRTPSPTPSEQRILQPKKMPRPPDMFKRENWGEHASRISSINAAD